MNALTKWNPFRLSTEMEPWGPLARWSPFRQMEELQREMDFLFSRRSLLPTLTEEPIDFTKWYPVVDITEDEKEFIVKAELPELKKEDVKVVIERGSLIIRGERKAEKEEKGKKYHRMERSYGSFERSFALPEGTEATKIHSEFKDGLLTVHLPKNPSATPKAIEIKVQ